MAKVTSKYQVTVPRTIAQQYKIRPGDEISWVAAGDVIRVIPPGNKRVGDDLESRLRLFDQARSWARQDLHERGRTH